MKFPKHKPARDPAFLEFVRKHLCCVCLTQPVLLTWGGMEIDGKVKISKHSDPHHLDGRGMGTKGSDYRTVPMCFCHHREATDTSKEKFEAKYDIDLDAVANELLKEWRGQ